MRHKAMMQGLWMLGTLGLSIGAAHGQAKKEAAPAAAPAAAAPAAAPAPTGGVTYKQKTVYDFDDDVVTGALVRPDGEFVGARQGARHSSLIKIRQNFVREMLKSAEDH